MKKNIALFSTGWMTLILHDFMLGLTESEYSDSYSIDTFICYPTVNGTKENNDGEQFIFALADFDKYDCAIIMANSLDLPRTCDFLMDNFTKRNIPVISIGKHLENAYCLQSDNYQGAYELALHLISVHHVQNPYFILGAMNNAEVVTRLNASKDVMEEFGLTFNSNNTFESGWDQIVTYKHIKELVNDFTRELPDAIICSNDELAMSVCSALEDSDFEVPTDIIVTGFDCKYDGQIYSPSIASVNQEYYFIGQKAFTMVHDLISGEEREQFILIPSKFIPSESCGCEAPENVELLRKKLGKKCYDDTLFDFAFADGLNLMEKALLECKALDDIFNVFREEAKDFLAFVGDSFTLVLFKEYFTDDNLSIAGFDFQKPTEAMLAFSIEQFDYNYDFNFDTSNLLPDSFDWDYHTFASYVPIHDNGVPIGYFAIGDNLKKVTESNYIYLLASRFGLVLSKIKSNLTD